jgi:hypothetical protein
MHGERCTVSKTMKKTNVPKLTRKDVLDSIPIKNNQLEWEKGEKGEVRINLPMKKTWWIKLLSTIFIAPKKRILTLDELGTKVWDMCDGTRNVENVVQALCRDLNMNRKEVETSLLHYLKTLAGRGLIGLGITKKTD